MPEPFGRSKMPRCRRLPRRVPRSLASLMSRLLEELADRHAKGLGDGRECRAAHVGLLPLGPRYRLTVKARTLRDLGQTHAAGLPRSLDAFHRMPGSNVSTILMSISRTTQRRTFAFADEAVKVAQAEPKGPAHELHNWDAALVGPLVEGRRFHGEHRSGLAHVEQAVGRCLCRPAGSGAHRGTSNPS